MDKKRFNLFRAVMAIFIEALLLGGGAMIDPDWLSENAKIIFLVGFTGIIITGFSELLSQKIRGLKEIDRPKPEAYDVFGNPVPTISDVDAWLKLKEITLSQAACLYEDIDSPSDGSVPSAVRPRLEQLKQLMRDGKLTNFALQLNTVDQISNNMNNLITGRMEYISDDARVKVDELIGALEPSSKTPKQLIKQTNLGESEITNEKSRY